MFEFYMPGKGVFEDYLQLVRATAAADKHVRMVQLSVQGTAMFLALFLLYAAEQTVVTAGDGEIPWLTLVILVVLGGLMLAYTMLYTRIQARRAWKIANKTEKSDGRTCFKEKEIVMENNGKTASFKYKDITAILHGHGYYFLFVASRQAIIVPERRIVTGTADEFKRFIARKTDRIIQTF